MPVTSPTLPNLAALSPINAADIITGSSITVGVGKDFTNLQAALDHVVTLSQNANHELVLTAGESFVGNFVLPAKTGSGWVTIRTSNLAQIPSRGTRIVESDSAFMPKVYGPTNGTSPVMQLDGSNRWRWLGVEVAVNPAAVQRSFVLMWVGGGPNDISGGRPHGGQATRTLDMTTIGPVIARGTIIERCYFHGWKADAINTTTGAGDLVRAILCASADFTVQDSIIDDIISGLNESQTITFGDGIGPYRIKNNTLGASGENIMSGGSDPSVTDLVPADFEITFNTIRKRLEWKTFPWIISKNLFELKNAERVLIEGNTLDNSYQGSQDGSIFVFNAWNQGNSAPWSRVWDVTCRNNVGSNAIEFCQINVGWGVPSQGVQRIQIYNNCGLNITSKFLRIARGIDTTVLMDSIDARKNTCLPCTEYGFRAGATAANGQLITGTNPAINVYPNLRYQDNITGFGQYGEFVQWDGGGTNTGGDAVWIQSANPFDFAGNALLDIGTHVNAYGQWNYDSAKWLLAGTPNAAGINLATGGLSSNSVLQGKGTDFATLVSIGVLAALPAPPVGTQPQQNSIADSFNHADTSQDVIDADLFWQPSAFGNPSVGAPVQILNNRVATVGTAAGYTFHRCKTPLTSDDHEATVTLANFVYGSLATAGVFIRGTGNTCIWVRGVRYDPGPTNQYDVWDVVNGVTGATPLLTVAHPPTLNDVMTLRAVGNQVTLTMNGVASAPATTTILAGRDVGMETSAWGGADHVELDSFSAQIIGAPQTDVVAPAVSLTTPANGSTVIGTVSVTATATDAVGVTGVRFFVDGVQTGGTLTAPPFTYAWNTTTYSNAVHTLRVDANDAAGNTGSQQISVTVNNAPPPPTPPPPPQPTPNRKKVKYTIQFNSVPPGRYTVYYELRSSGSILLAGESAPLAIGDLPAPLAIGPTVFEAE